MSTAAPPSRLARAICAAILAAGVAAAGASAWTPLPVSSDPLVRMPGTQAGQLSNVEPPNQCLNCHDFAAVSSPARAWKGSMMAQAARDFLFFAAVTVAAQDSIWAVGRPNGTDICLRCHFPEGWVEGRSDPTNASALAGSDYDGVHCGLCHRLMDPFFIGTYDGTREGNDWPGWWDESGASATPSQAAADTAYGADAAASDGFLLFDGEPFFDAAHLPASPAWVESAGGQLFLAPEPTRRASFADAQANHEILYSRHHKSKYLCGACHDVSNPVLANLAFEGTPPGDGTTRLPTETQSAHSFMHVERTFSEFMLSDFALPGGAPGLGPWAPGTFDTSLPGDFIGRCQDCHMPDVAGKACDKTQAVLRPTGSVEHPKSGVPQHDLTGGNVWVSRVLASAVAGSPDHDATNAALLGQGPAVLTLDLDQGLGIDATALLAGADRALAMLGRAAAVEAPTYDSATGFASFRVRNLGGHKLPSGYPEGRRVFVSVRLSASGSLLWEVNPYSAAAGTLIGLDPEQAPGSPPLGPGQAHVDELVYEAKMRSSLLGGVETFHFVLADGREKDNRIPPRGFRLAEAASRVSTPVWNGTDAPALFTPAEYAGGFDDVEIELPPGGDRLEVAVYYQVTSREYVEFLRGEIEGTLQTLPPAAYVAQTDPFFAALAAWGGTIWQLWLHNRDLPGAAPVLLASATWEGVPAGTIFADGFESGGTSAWSDTEP